MLAQPADIATSPNSKATQQNSRQTFFADGFYWAFVNDGNQIGINKSSDGVGFSNLTSLPISATSISATNKNIGGTEYVFLAYTDSSTGDIFVRRGTISGGLIFFTTSFLAIDNTAPYKSYIQSSIILDSNNYLWVAGVNKDDFQADSQSVFVAKSSVLADNSSLTFAAPTQMGRKSADINKVVLLSSANAKLSLLVSIKGAIKAYNYDGSNWVDGNNGGAKAWTGYANGSEYTQYFSDTYYIEAIESDGNGNLYIGGNFQINASNGTARGIVRWDGTNFYALGTGEIYGVVSAIKIIGSDIYVGGNFTDIDGISNTKGIAKWNGSAWESVCDGINASVKGVTIWDGEVIVYGNSSFIPRQVARCSGGSWVGIGSFNQTEAYTAEVYGSDLLIGSMYGLFRIPLADKTSSITVLSGTNIQALEVDGSNVYLGGSFTEIGGDTNIKGIANWDGSNFYPLGSGVSPASGSFFGASATKIKKIGGFLYVAGDFASASGEPNTAYFAKWNGLAWSSGSANYPQGPYLLGPRAIASFQSKLFVGTSGFSNGEFVSSLLFSFPGDDTLYPFAYKSGQTGAITKVLPYGNGFFLGGQFQGLNGDKNLNGVAYYNADTNTFAPLGAGIRNFSGFLEVRDMLIVGGKLYIVGNFSDIIGVSNTNNLAVWDIGTSTWTNLTSIPGVNSDPSQSTIYALTSDPSGKVYFSGSFLDEFYSPALNNLFIYEPNTQTWSNPSGVFQQTAMSVAYVSDNEIYVGTYGGVYRYDGLDWVYIGLYDITFPEAFPGAITQMISHSGRLYVSGERALGYWDGSAWHRINSAGYVPSDDVLINSMVLEGNKLFLAGQFSSLGNAGIIDVGYFDLSDETFKPFGSNADLGQITGLVNVNGNYFATQRDLGSSFLYSLENVLAGDSSTAGDFSAVSDASLENEYMVSYLNPAGNVRFKKSQAGVWNEAITLYSSNAENPNLSIDSVSKKLGLFFTHNNSLLFYNQADTPYGAGNWEASPTGVYDSGSANINFLTAGESQGDTSEKFFTVWTEGVSSPYNVKFITSTTGPAPIAPQVTNVTSSALNQTYGPGSVIPISVSFSLPVNVVGTPQLALNSGAVVSYASGSGTDTLTFNYTVQSGEGSSDLDYLAVSSLSLGGGTIKSLDNVNANLLLPTPGAVSSLGNNKDIVIDAQAPAVPVITSPASNITVNYLDPIISGTKEIGSYITLYRDNGGNPVEVYAGISNESTWVYQGSGYSFGTSETFYAVSRDLYGNSSAQSNAVTITFQDTILGAGEVTIDSIGGGSPTQDSTPTFMGKAPANQNVTIKSRNAGVYTTLGTASSDAAGNWSFTPVIPLPDASYTFYAFVSLTSPSVELRSSAYELSVDTVLPFVSLYSPTEGYVTNNPRPEFYGASEIGATVYLKIDGNTYTIPSLPSTDWSYTPLANLADGVHSVSVSASDAAGNQAPFSTPISIEIDSTDLTPPTIIDVTSSNANGNYVTNQQIYITVEFSEPVKIDNNGIGNVFDPYISLNSGGGAKAVLDDADVSSGMLKKIWTFSYVVSQYDKSSDLDAKLAVASFRVPESIDGQLKGIRDEVGLSLVTTLPAIGDANSLSFNKEIRINTSERVPNIAVRNFQVFSDASPELRGGAEPGSLVEIFVDEVSSPIISTTADAFGNWIGTSTVDLSDGLHDLKVRSTLGSSILNGNSVKVIINANLFIPSISAPLDTSYSTDPMVVIRGVVGSPGATVNIYLNNSLLGSTLANGAGLWNYTVVSPGLADGNYTVYANITISGNTHPNSQVVTFRIDTTPPLPPGITKITNNGDGTFTVIGTTEPEATIKVYGSGSILLGETTADASGDWIIHIASNVTSISVTATDRAGNTSSPTNGVVPPPPPPPPPPGGEGEQLVKSTVNFMWNGFLEMVPVISSRNRSSEYITGEMVLYDKFGAKISSLVIPIPADGTNDSYGKNGQYDALLSLLPEFDTKIKNNYGTGQINYHSTVPNLVDVFTSSYTRKPGSLSFSFAYLQELDKRPIIGESYTIFNSLQPDATEKKKNNFVPNWLSIAIPKEESPSSTAYSFDVEFYDMSGKYLSTTHLALAAGSREDIFASPLLGVGIVKVIPNASIGYLVSNNRYGSDAPFGQPATNYDFAVPLVAGQGKSGVQYVPFSNVDSIGRKSVNWLEVANVDASGDLVRFEYINKDGVIEHTDQLFIDPKAQIHLSINNLFPNASTGLVKITSSSKLLVQSMQYYGYGTPFSLTAISSTFASNSFPKDSVGSYNTFEQGGVSKSFLSVFNITDSEQPFVVKIQTNEGIKSFNYTISARANLQISIEELVGKNTYGALHVISSADNQLYSVMRRFHEGVEQIRTVKWRVSARTKKLKKVVSTMNYQIVDFNFNQNLSTKEDIT